MNSYGLLCFFVQAESVTLSKTQTPMDSNGLSRTLAASLSFWLELVSTPPRTLTPMNSYGLLWSVLSYLVSYSFKTLTPMNSNGLRWTLAASDLACVYSSWIFDSNELLLTLLGFYLRLGSLLFLNYESYGLTWTLPASSSLWLELVLLILELWLLWTPLDSSGLFSRARSVTLS